MSTYVHDPNACPHKIIESVYHSTLYPYTKRKVLFGGLTKEDLVSKVAWAIAVGEADVVIVPPPLITDVFGRLELIALVSRLIEMNGLAWVRQHLGDTTLPLHIEDGWAERNITCLAAIEKLKELS